MASVILDDDLRAKLNGLNEVIPFREPSGETVGHFVPDGMYLKLLYSHARDAVSKEELDAAAAETGGRRWSDFRGRVGGV